RREIARDKSVTMAADPHDTLRLVRHDGPELRPNVIQITVESLSADFLSIFNRASNLTPNLAEIAGQSLVFDNFYATGTRTDRGMEALTLAVPPTPGRSLVKRPRNEDLFTLGSVSGAGATTPRSSTEASATTAIASSIAHRRRTMTLRLPMPGAPVTRTFIAGRCARPTWLTPPASD